MTDARRKLPTTVKVGQAVYKVGQRRDSVESGSCETNKQQILIDPTLAFGAKRLTLLHESLHGILAESGALYALGLEDDEKGEEKLVRLLAPWLLMLLRDNPDMLACLVAP